MYRDFLTMALTMAALAAATGWTAQASAQYPTALPAPAPVAAPYSVPAQQIVVTPPASQAVGPFVAPGTRTFSVQYVPAAPNSVIPGTGGTPTVVTQPRPVPPTAGMITAISPQPTYATTTMQMAGAQPYPVTNIVNQPFQAIPQNTQVYTPTYYYYYYQQEPYQASDVPVAPVQMAPVMPAVPFQPVVFNGGYGDYGSYGGDFGYGGFGGGGIGGGIGGGYSGASGPMFNARGEMGHVRYPYYSYRRPWYWAGQPSFNATIPGPIW